MTTLITEQTQAYVNYSRWVANCGRPFCSNALRLKGGETTFVCVGGDSCGWEGIIIWPPNAQEIWDTLMLRPVKSTRNWFPEGHPLAVRHNLPMGLTPQGLIDEQKEWESLGDQ